MKCQLLSTLKFEFADHSLFEQALTHRSAGSRNNERLEFLGDAVIELIVSQWLYEAIPEASEGRMTRYRAAFVRKESLAQLARELDLGTLLALGGGELKSGGRQRESILADGFEALFGAMFLDRGLDACRESLLPMLEPQLQEIRDGTPKDPKTQLQEYLQGRGMPTPEYAVIATHGAAHQQEFVVECQVEELKMSSRGTGTSRRRSEQSAAQQLLDDLENVSS